MKVYQDSKYNADFPENYTWNKIDSIKLSKIAVDLKGWLQHDLGSASRNLVPGLRKALDVIAQKAEML